MKTSIKIAAFVIVMMMGFTVNSERVVAQNATFQLFYDELTPYGNWVWDVNYGYVWVPNVEPGFMPYATNGNWASTDNGWPARPPVASAPPRRMGKAR
ncbi:MAG: DUF6600 domain-containing protein [Bacteroidota bacterium]